LRLADDELATLLDLEVRRREPPGQHVVAGLGPVEDIDELLLHEIHRTHCALRAKISSHGATGMPEATNNHHADLCGVRPARVPQTGGRVPSRLAGCRCGGGALVTAEGRRRGSSCAARRAA